MLSVPKGGEPDRRCPRRRTKDHGTSVARYDAPRGSDGKRRQVTLPERSSTEAEAALAKALTGSHQGVPIADRQIAIADYFTSWLASRTAIRPSAAASYAAIVDIYVKPGIGHIQLGDLRSTDIEQLFAVIRQLAPRLPERPSPMLQRITAARRDRPDGRRTRCRVRIER